jgi:hypothetical protein
MERVSGQNEGGFNLEQKETGVIADGRKAEHPVPEAGVRLRSPRSFWQHPTG